MYDSFSSYRTVLDFEGVESGADLTLAGTPEEILEGLARYAEAGATDLRIVISSRTDEEREATKAFLTASLARAD